MPIGPGTLLVCVLYGVALYVILVVEPRLSGASRETGPWYRNVRFWASFVAIVQIVTYVLLN